MRKNHQYHAANLCNSKSGFATQKASLSLLSLLGILIVLIFSQSLLANPSAPVINITSVAQRTDGSRLVDIIYDLNDANGDLCEISLKLSDDDGATFTYIPNPANLSADIGVDIAPGSGKSIIWNAGAEGVEFDGSQYVLNIKAEDGQFVIPDNFVYVQGGTIYPTTGIYTDGLTVSSFYIDKYEITQSEWNAVMDTGGGDSYPQAFVSWFDAIEYCNRRSIIEGITPCYSYLDYDTDPDDWPPDWNATNTNAANISCDWNAIGYRLPSEAEWEYAARGGLQTHDYTYSGSNDLSDVGWYSINSGSTSHPVGQLAPNELEIYDMSGNIYEWCWDQFIPYSDRIIRGGDFYDDAAYSTVFFRFSTWPTRSSSVIGFRVCRRCP